MIDSFKRPGGRVLQLEITKIEEVKRTWVRLFSMPSGPLRAHAEDLLRFNDLVFEFHSAESARRWTR
jgi:hypothetical protein